MKNVIITEEQRKRLFEAYRDGFDLNYLYKLDNLNDVNDYCRKYLGNPFANGSSRAVYTLNESLVLKVACIGDYVKKEDVGCYQNFIEWKLFNDTRSPILARVLAHGKNFIWIISEHTLPCVAEDFEKVLGIPFNTSWQNQSKPMNAYFGKDGHSSVGYNKYFDDNMASKTSTMADENGLKCIDVFLDYSCDKCLGLKDTWDDETSKTLDRIISETPWMKEVDDLCMKYGIRDLHLGNFGLVNRNGNEEIVIIDSGLDDNGYKRYY